jgi:hypothetical protein
MEKEVSSTLRNWEEETTLILLFLLKARKHFRPHPDDSCLGNTYFMKFSQSKPSGNNRVDTAKHFIIQTKEGLCKNEKPSAHLSDILFFLVGWVYLVDSPTNFAVF